jgi:hypothetical protein
MTTDTKTKYEKAVYVELVSPTSPMSGTVQILIMPEGTSSAEKLVPVTMYRRRVAPHAPRKTWKMISSAVTTTQARMAVPGGMAIDSSVAESVMSFVTSVLANLGKHGWQVYRQPIVVEVTNEDLEAARLSKTPYKVIGRVLKSRAALGFPKEIIHPTSSF